MKKILRLRYIIPTGIILIVVIIATRGGKEEKLVLSEAKRTNVEQVVTITGNVKPNQFVDLAFEKTGRIRSAAVAVGQTVGIGQTLLVLENADIQADLLEANAQLKAQQAKLDELKKGSLPEDIQVEEVRLENAKRSLENEKRKAADTIHSLYTKAEDTVRNTIDRFFSNPRSSNPIFNHGSDSTIKTSIEFDRLKAEAILKSWGQSMVDVTPSNVTNHFTEATVNLNQIKSLLDKVSLVINSLTPTTSLSQTTIDAYRADVSAARTAISTELANLTAAQDTITSAENQIKLSESQLALKKTPTRPEQIRAQEASVEQAIAHRDSVQSQLAKTVLRSPIAGTVSAVDVKVGEIVAPNIKVVSVISSAKYKIEAFVPEADVANLKIGDTAVISLDAVQDVGYSAKIGSIDPAETLREGVPTYKVTLFFDKADDHIRSGLTANVEIITASKSDVIAIPARAIVEKSDKKIVRTKANKDADELIEREVVTGLRGSNGDIEIVSGLQAGEIVVTSSEN